MSLKQSFRHCGDVSRDELGQTGHSLPADFLQLTLHTPQQHQACNHQVMMMIRREFQNHIKPMSRAPSNTYNTSIKHWQDVIR